MTREITRKITRKMRNGKSKVTKKMRKMRYSRMNQSVLVGKIAAFYIESGVLT